MRLKIPLALTVGLVLCFTAVNLQHGHAQCNYFIDTYWKLNYVQSCELDSNCGSDACRIDICQSNSWCGWGWAAFCIDPYYCYDEDLTACWGWNCT
jgi:hypothetical protein